MRQLLFQLFLILSIFFHSVQKKFSKKKNTHVLARFSAGLIYCLLLSLVFGIFPTILALVIFSQFANPEMINSDVTLFLVPLFLFLCMALILILNFKEQSFSLPRNIFIFVAVIVLSNPKRHFLYTWFTVLSALTIFFLTSSYIAIDFFLPSLKTSQSIFNTLIYTASFSFILTVMIYSYGSANSVLRLYRKFVLWTILLLGISCYTIVQIYDKLSQPINKQLQIEMVLLIGGLIFTFTGVLDKGEELVSRLSQQHAEQIKRSWKINYKQYSIELLIAGSTSFIIGVRQAWARSKKIVVIMRAILLIIIGFILYKAVDILQNVLMNIDSYAGSILDNNQQESLSSVLPLIFFLGLNVYLIIQFKRRYRLLSWSLKGIGYCILMVFVMMFCSMANTQYIHSSVVDSLIRSSLFVSALGLFLIMLVDSLWKAYQWFKK